MKAKIFAYLPARNEEQHLANCLESLLHQTLKPTILVINDGSTDETEKIALNYKVNVITLPFHKESYLSNIHLAYKLATVVNHVFPLPKNIDYMMAIAPDIILPLDYIEKLVKLMEEDPKLVIASGVIKGEKCLRSHPRGAGRMFKTWFWNEHIHTYPENYTWESYPLYKAASLGLKTESFPNLIFKTTRPTKNYKSNIWICDAGAWLFSPFCDSKMLNVHVFFSKRRNNDA